MICKCGNLIPQKRANLGFTFCVECSPVQKASGHLVVHHKTGNEYQIITDPEVAEKIASMASRNGFGSNRKSVTRKGTNIKKIIPPPDDFKISPLILNRKPADESKCDDEGWTLAILDKFSTSPEEAIKLLSDVFSDGKISPIARKRLLAIINPK